MFAFTVFGVLADAASCQWSSCSELSCDLVRQALPANLYLGPAAFRFGEAAHPGPADILQISTSNPSGLRNKESLYSDWGAGIHCFSETQLSAVTLPSSCARFRRLAKAVRPARVLEHRLRCEPIVLGLAHGLGSYRCQTFPANIFSCLGPRASMKPAA